MYDFKKSHGGTLVAFVCLTLGGCDEALYDNLEDDPIEDIFRDSGSGGLSSGGGGIMMNGSMVNGIEGNGFSDHRILMDGLLVTNPMLNGSPWEGSTVDVEGLPYAAKIVEASLNTEDNRLLLTDKDGQQFDGVDVIGAHFNYKTPHGEYRIIIDDANQIGGPLASADLWEYSLLIQTRSYGQWSPKANLCQDHTGGEVTALLVTGMWNHTTGERTAAPGAITISCRQGAIAKCVEWGYRITGSDTDWAHDACVRMARADYEGVGISYTLPGTRIYGSDMLGINTFVDPGLGVELVKEAEWTPNGATCINRRALRQSGQTDCDMLPGPGVEDCFSQIPECTDPYNLAPSSHDVLVTAVDIHQL